MDLCLLLLLVALMNTARDFHVSACDEKCADKPVFTPSRLVVKHGDPTSATCSVCQSACQGLLFDLENSVGVRTTNGTTIKWTVDKLTEWDMSPTCYYYIAANDTQCCSILNVTVYKPPDSVSISVSNHTAPMLEGHQYNLQCAVHDVAPVENLIVTFYRGKTPLGRPQSKNNTEKKPVSETYTLSITASKEDDGVQYWCEAKLELGPEGPQPPVVMKSQNITTTVYYKPQLKVSQKSINLTAGTPLRVNCSAVGNPKPSITWTLANSSLLKGSVLYINSVATEDKGEYNCSASNMIGTVVESVQVEVQANYMPFIIALAVIAAAVVLILFGVGYCHYYRNYRMGQYNLKDVFRLHKQHIPVPIA